jgi:alpha-ribazole phosphatase/probable phosphoglycerate mutase
VLTTTIDFIRHGEAVGGSYYRGCTNDPLTKHGWQQMNATVANRSWDQIISSPLDRCLDFAQQINRKTSIPLSTDSNWQEINFGDWEGKTAAQINPDVLMRFYQSPIDSTPENGESYTDFLSRINQSWENLIKIHSGKHILVITHGGVIRSLFTLLLGLPVERMFNLQVDHAGLTRFQCFHDSPDNFVKLIFHNLTSSDLS